MGQGAELRRIEIRGPARFGSQAVTAEIGEPAEVIGFHPRGGEAQLSAEEGGRPVRLLEADRLLGRCPLHGGQPGLVIGPLMEQPPIPIK